MSFFYLIKVFFFSTISRARSNSGMVATGGGQSKFESRMVLLRKSPDSNSFDQPIQSGSVVPLGEEIVLRATVQDGDGKYITQYNHIYFIFI